MVTGRAERRHPRFVSSCEKRPRAALALWIRQKEGGAELQRAANAASASALPVERDRGRERVFSRRGKTNGDEGSQEILIKESE